MAKAGDRLENIRGVFDDVAPLGTPLTTTEVADALDQSRRTVYNRLQELVGLGEIDTKKVGAKGRVWWRHRAVSGRMDVSESRQQTATGTNDHSDVVDGDSTGPDTEHRSDRTHQAIGLTGLLDAFPSNIALLDEEGDIVATNQAWREFATENGATISPGMLAINYLDVVKSADNEYARLATDGLEQVLGGDSDGFECEYPCHSPSERRWYLMHAGGFTYRGTRYVLVEHIDITDRTERKLQLERTREQLNSEINEIFDRIDDGFLALDEQWQATYLNTRAEEYLNKQAADILGENIWRALPDQAESTFRGALERVMQTQESESVEVCYDDTTTWLKISAYPSSTGLSVYLQDITERKQREQTLETTVERLNTLVTNAPVILYALDADGTFTLSEGKGLEKLGLAPGEVVGESVFDVYETHDTIVESIERALDGEAVTTVHEVGDLVFDSTHEPVFDETGSVTAMIGVAVDITEQKERERELEISRQRYQTLVENFPDGTVALVDTDLRCTTIGGSVDYFDRSLGDIEGAPIDETLPPEIADVLVPRYVEALDGRESVFEHDFGAFVYQFHIVPIRDDDGTVFAALGMSQEITERVDSHRQLTTRMQQQSAITEFGRMALETRDIDRLLTDAVELVSNTLDAASVTVFELDSGRQRLLPRVASGCDGTTEDHLERVTDSPSWPVSALDADDPVVSPELPEKASAAVAENQSGWGISAGITPSGGKWGLLCVYGAEPEAVSDHAVQFVDWITNTLSSAIGRRHRERQIERQRERVATLNSINTAVLDVAQTINQQSSRAGIENAICDRLASSDAYTSAWIGEFDPETATITDRASASPEHEGPIPNGSVVAPDGVGADALRTISCVTEQADLSGSDVPIVYTPDGDHRTVALAPIVHGGRQYGLLGVTTSRASAFTGSERGILTQLGQTIGHGIASVQRKQALTSDDLVEISFQIDDFFDVIGADVSTEGEIVFHRLTQTGADTSLLYGTATGVSRETLDRFAANLSGCEEVLYLEEQFGKTRFSLRLLAQPITEIVASQGGKFVDARITDGTYTFTARFPPSVDVSAVFRLIEQEYPESMLVKQRQITRSDDKTSVIHAFINSLTEQQRTVLEASYYGGFFDHPRRQSGQELADTLEIAPPTFHHHLRVAHRKLLGEIFS